MHTKEVSESDGEFGGMKRASRPCPKCGSADHFYRVWESDCGGYEDEKHECRACGKTWWVESADS